MTALQGAVAELHTLVKDFPEPVHVAAGGKSDIHQVDGDNALVEAAVVFGLAVLVQIGGQEASAAHAGVAVAFSVFVHLILEHDFFGNVIGYHTLGSTLGSQLCQIVVGILVVDIVVLQHIDKLREGRSNPDALLIFDTLITLTQGFFYNKSQILLFLFVLCLVQIHEDGDERSLSVGGHQRYDLILNHLYAVFNLFPQTLLGNEIDLLLGHSLADGV